MLGRLLLSPKGQAPDALAALIRLVQFMPESTRALWYTRFVHVYGELSGQRGIDLSEFDSWLGTTHSNRNLHDIIFGIQTFYVLVADLLAVAATEKDPVSLLKMLSTLPQSAFLSWLRKLSSGICLEEHGIHGGRAAFDLDWYTNVADRGTLEGIRALVVLLSENWKVIDLARRELDPLHGLYISLIHRNLLHTLGEVYTPAWLAEMLLSDSGWAPGRRLIDPFGGNGIFLLAALKETTRRGLSPFEVLPDLCMVDLNPIACAAARSNLVLFLSAQKPWPKREVHLPVLSGDALSPALLSSQSESDLPLFSQQQRISVDGEVLPVSINNGTPDSQLVAKGLARYGVSLPMWLRSSKETRLDASQLEGEISTRDRRFWEQLAILALQPADVVATNPPWVGWEYISRPYRAYLEPAWKKYALFTATGRDASFLKEDLSTLALVVAWDRYLSTGGTSVAVLRSNAMTSSLAAKGLRRLSIFPAREPLELIGIRIFNGIRVFPDATVETASWKLAKGKPTAFPVNVQISTRNGNRRRSQGDAPGEGFATRDALAERAIATDPGSRWVIGNEDCVQASRAISGENSYSAHTGVFTGGANAVFYLEAESNTAEGQTGWFRNITERAKRDAPQVRVRLEKELVYEVVRGRDLHRWVAAPGSLILCPHNRETRMHAIGPEILQSRYPLAWEYLAGMKKVLDQRKGFTEWERSFRDEAFYAIQRIGSYSFAPYKVAWRYIASDFLVSVIGPDKAGRTRLANDKVIFVGLDNAEDAYYLCGILSSDPFRWRVTSYASETQISVSSIEPLNIPTYDSDNVLQRGIAYSCEQGHGAVSDGRIIEAMQHLDDINHAVAELFGIDEVAMKAFRKELLFHCSNKWFSPKAISRSLEGPAYTS